MARYLLDTDTVVDYFKGIPTTLEFVNGLYRQGDDICTCDVVVAEVYSGLYPEHRERGRTFINSMKYLLTTESAARQAGLWRYDFARRGRQLSTPDCLVAAIALERRATLVTGNVRDYPMAELTLLPLLRRA